MSDREMQRARNAQTGYIEAKVMFKVNKTGEWLSEQGDGEKHARLSLAREQSHAIAKEEKAMKIAIQKKLDDLLKDSKKKLAQKDDKDRERYESWLESVYNNGGLWENEEDIEKALGGMNKTRSLVCLKAQINVRVKILKCCTGEGRVFLKNDVEYLKGSLLKLIHADVSEDVLDVYELLLHPRSLVGTSFSQRWRSEDSSINWHGGFIVNITEEEFKLEFDDGSFCFFTTDELLVDIIRGDLELC